MNDDQKQDLKKGVSNSFVWLLLAAFLLMMLVQNMIETKKANVSFSYQLESLVNLQLLQPEDSRKIALNDNLVTFSGKFRERQTEEGKQRFKYLELLNGQIELTQQQQQVTSQLEAMRGAITEAAEWFLLLTGQSVPKEGYVVVEDFYSNANRDYSIIVKKLPEKKTESLADLKKKFSGLNPDSPEQAVDAFGSSLSGLIKNFRSPYLGIGSEPMKQNLKNIDIDVSRVNGTLNLSTSNRLSTYGRALEGLQQIVDELNTPQNRTRLAALRSVRSYKSTIEELNQISTKLEDNAAQLEKARQSVANVVWFFNNKELSTRSLEKQDPEAFSQWFATAKEEWDRFPKNMGASFKAPDQPLNLVLEKTFKSEETPPNYLSYLVTFLPLFLILFGIYFLFSRQMKGMGTNAINFGKSPAKLLQKGANKLTFKDVAGAEEAIEELQEIVEFLRSPNKFTTLGGRIPKGVLLIGPPGTGKTLIAKAVAGEADRPFFSISGSDFVEMFVGVGASRIRDMFAEAKKNAPCIIFMDEIDAVGRHRGAGIGGGHDEREQTLNQLLVEMDGFDTNEGVILMAATNRPDVLDRALLRPGRFDRRVVISLPDIKGRYEILKVHARRIKLDPNVDLMAIARATPGASGADLANLLNEAALLAARKGRTAVTMQEATEARDKVLFGKERRSLELDNEEKRTTAYHESGHAIVGLVVEHADPIDKVTIIPRGMSLGATFFLPKKNRVSFWKREAHDQLAVLMGGRVAEEIFVEDISSGARQDIEQATHLARSMVCEWGMSEKLGLVAYDERTDAGQHLGLTNYYEKKYSEETAKAIDNEVRNLLDEAHKRAKEIILKYRDQLELMAQMLMEFETLDAKDVELIINGQWEIEEKRQRIRLAEDLNKKTPIPPPPPPPPPAKAVEGMTPSNLQPDIRV